MARPLTTNPSERSLTPPSERRARRGAMSRVTTVSFGMVAMLATAILPASAALGSSPSIGTITEFTVHTPGSDLSEIAAGPDGSLWFTEFLGDKIGPITPNGTVTEFSITSTTTPAHITTSPAGELWFLDGNRDHDGRITHL